MAPCGPSPGARLKCGPPSVDARGAAVSRHPLKTRPTAIIDSRRDAEIRVNIAPPANGTLLTKHGIVGERPRCRRDVTRTEVDSARGRAGKRRGGESRATGRVTLHSSGDAAACTASAHSRNAENKIFQALADPSRRALLRVAHARRSRGEGPHGALRHLAAGGLAASRHFERRRPGERPPRGALRLLPGGAARDEATHRLDPALPRLLDGARGSP